MKRQDVPDQPVTDELDDPPWLPPPPPELESREWFRVMFGRFGFWIVSALVISVLALLFFKADQIPQAFKTSSTVVPEATAEEPDGPAQPQSVPVDEPQTAALAGVTLSITTDPAGAAIFVDGDYVGTSPLRDVTLPEGRRLISMQKPDYAQLDTFVTLDETATVLDLTLREAGTVLLADNTMPIADEEQLPVEDEARQEAADEDPASTDAIPVAIAEETNQTAPEQTTPPSPPDEPSRETGQADVEEETIATEQEPAVTVEEAAVATEDPETDEETPVVPFGQLQIASEPSGASVWVAGQVRGTTPLMLSEVQTGLQQITLRLDGYEDFTTTVDVVAQQVNTVTGQLKQLLGTLKILVRPWGAIYIGGELRKEESSIWYVAELPAGYHRVRVVHPSLGNWEQVVEVPAGDEQAITIDFNKSGSDQGNN